jgi:isocitrate dehydrogenase kinase/phosphatase
MESTSESSSLAARGAGSLFQGFLEYHERYLEITRRARERFERRDWGGIRRDTVARLSLHAECVDQALSSVRRQLGDRFRERLIWYEMKAAYTRIILGRDDFEVARTFYNSVTRKVFPHVGVDPAIDYTSKDFPLPFKGWEMASARTYAVPRVDPEVVGKVLEDARFRVAFEDSARDAQLLSERIEAAIEKAFGSAEVDGLDVLRPVLFRNKAAYIVGRARRDERVVPLLMPVLHGPAGLYVDALIASEEEASVVFSFARWYFHADVSSPRQLIGFLHSILPRKRLAELYISLGYNKHGKTEFYADLMSVIASSDEQFVVAPGEEGLVMSVFTLPSYEFVFKVIKDHFPQQKKTSRWEIMEKYKLVLLHDRVGRLVDFQSFEHLNFSRERFSDELLENLLEVAGNSVEVDASNVVIKHCYIGRRVTPLDIHLRTAPPAAVEAAVVDWGHALKDLAATNIFPGDMLLKNFGVTRHGRVVFYDYDEVTPLVDCNFRRFPPPRNDFDEMSSEPWFSVAENDVFPEEFETFLGLPEPLRKVFDRHHADLFDLDYWRRVQERTRQGEILDFIPYDSSVQLRPGLTRSEAATAG